MKKHCLIYGSFIALYKLNGKIYICEWVLL